MIVAQEIIEVCLPILLIAGRNRAAAPIFCITEEKDAIIHREEDICSPRG
jgi:hypothetical protein